MSVTNVQWIRGFLTAHPENEHKRASSLKYIGKHAYIDQWYDQQRYWQEIGTIVEYNGHRALLLHNILWTAEPFNGRFDRSAYPLRGYHWWRNSLGIDYPYILEVEYHYKDDFRGQSDEAIIRTMRDRLEARLTDMYEHRELCRRWKFRRAVDEALAAYNNLSATFFHGAMPDRIKDICAELRSCREDTPENRHIWASSAAKAGAVSRAENAELREQRRKHELEVLAMTDKFCAWIEEQDWYVRWELELMLTGRNDEKPVDRYPGLAPFMKVINGTDMRRILHSGRLSMTGRRVYDTFVTALIDSYSKNPVIYLVGETWWHTERIELADTEGIDRVIAGLSTRPIPVFPEALFEGMYRWRTESYGNYAWTIKRTDNVQNYYSDERERTLNSLNRGYLIERLNIVKEQLLARQREQ